ncbi:nucleotidyl transferase AbiEii/AbiGii toxin family protein [Patescibacteria group bacterium]|nr:nucleotidyl transferase AbiEii/AbiGii toxin family protein [Patescibacteria group bacterium]
MIIDSLQGIVKKNKGVNDLFLRNLLKESLQLYTLNFIYTSVYAERLLFKGGACLRFCFGLPRLSEDLDFDIKNISQFSLKKFTNSLQDYFVKKLQYKNLTVKVAGNKKQIFLKFPLMEKLGLRADRSESNILFLRIDLSPVDSSIFKEEISLKANDDFNFIIKRYSLPDLFASKIAAVLQRTFHKGRKDLITFKGRDYFDLIWFLERGTPPNLERLKDILKIQKCGKILELLDDKVKMVKEEYLKEDLLPLFQDKDFVENFTRNFKTLYQQKREVLNIE